MRRLLIALLAGALIVTTAPAAGAHDDHDDDNERSTYLALGDSVAAGTQQPNLFTDGYTGELFEDLLHVWPLHLAGEVGVEGGGLLLSGDCEVEDVVDAAELLHGRLSLLLQVVSLGGAARSPPRPGLRRRRGREWTPHASCRWSR